MARYLYAASPADYVVDATTGLPIPGAVVTVWSARSGGSQITDLQDLSGTAVSSVTANAQGFYAFYCPDSYTENVWLSTGTGDRLVCRTVESPALVSQVVGKAGGTMTGPLVLSADPTLEMHAATKQYVDEHSAGSVTISGGTLTGNLVLSSGADLFIGGTGEPRGQFRQQTDYSVVIQPSDNSGNLLGSKEFLYSVADGRWQFESGLRVDGAVSVGGALAMGSNKITGLADGTAAGDAVNKSQLDSVEGTANAALPKAGGTMSGAVAMGGYKVTGLGNGSASGDAVNKGQLDAVSTVANAALPTARVKTWVGPVSGGGTTVTLGTSPTGTWSVVASVRLSGSGDQRIVRVTNVDATSCVLYVWDESYLGFTSATCSLIAMAA